MGKIRERGGGVRTIKKYCPNCNKETIHRVLPKTSFLGDCAIALLTCGKADLVEWSYECNDCKGLSF